MSINKMAALYYTYWKEIYSSVKIKKSETIFTKAFYKIKLSTIFSKLLRFDIVPDQLIHQNRQTWIEDKNEFLLPTR